MDLVLPFTWVLYTNFSKDFWQKLAFLWYSEGHLSLAKGPPIPSVHIFLLQLRNCSGWEGTCKFPGRRLVCDPRWRGHGWVQDIIHLVPTLPSTGYRVNINHVWSPGHHCTHCPGHEAGKMVTRSTRHHVIVYYLLLTSRGMEGIVKKFLLEDIATFSASDWTQSSARQPQKLLNILRLA